VTTSKGKTSVDEHGQVKEQESRKRLEAELRVLQKELSFLLELFLRVPDLPGLHGRKSLGNDLQPHYLGMPGLRQDSFFLILFRNITGSHGLSDLFRRMISSGPLPPSVPLGDINVQPLYLPVQRTQIDAEIPRRERPVAPMIGERFLNQRFLDAFQVHSLPGIHELASRDMRQVRWEMMEFNRPGTTQHECVLQDILQLSNIAGKIMA
jgi:hypothetical protein